MKALIVTVLALALSACASNTKQAGNADTKTGAAASRDEQARSGDRRARAGGGAHVRRGTRLERGLAGYEDP